MSWENNIETGRLIIRYAQAGDATDIYEMLCDERILKYNCMKKPTLQEVEQSILHNNKNNFFIELKSNKKVIGAISLEEDDLRYQVNSLCLSYYLNSDYLKQGYMSEAVNIILDYVFNKLNKDIICTRCFEPNIDSKKLLIRNGFTYEGTLRNAVKGYNDIIYSDCLFSLLKSEYSR